MIPLEFEYEAPDTLQGAIALLSDWARRGMMWGGGSRRRGNGGRGAGASD